MISMVVQVMMLMVISMVMLIAMSIAMLIAILVKVSIMIANFGLIKLVKSSDGSGNLTRLLIPV